MADASTTDWRGRSLTLGRSFYTCVVAAVVVGLVLAFVASQLHLVPWGLLASVLPLPWNQVLNPTIGPKTIRLLAAEALGFSVVVGGAALVFASSRVRSIFGNGSLVVFRRAISLAWVPVLASVYLLTYARADHWILTIVVHGAYVNLTVPALLGVVFFGVAALALAPAPTGHYLPLPLEILANVAPFAVSAGVVLSLDQNVATVPRPWETYVANVIIIQITLATAEIIYVLTAAEAASADWQGLQQIWADHHPSLIPAWERFGDGPSTLGDRLRDGTAEFRRRARNAGSILAASFWVVPAFGRFVLRLGIFIFPVLFGAWMALGYHLSYASTILDRNGQVLEYYSGNAPFRLYVSADHIAPVLYEALDATEDPGIYTSPATHSPINPVRVAGIFTAAASAGALSGGSGIATQSCKNMIGRSLSDDVATLPHWVPLKRFLVLSVTLGQKLAFEFPCGWAFERTALFTRPRGWIVAFYLNQIYLGQGVYGARAASETYFGKDPSRLTLSEAALIAGLPQAPSYYNPWVHPTAVRDRRLIVAHSMVREGYITPQEEQTLDAAPLGVLSKPWDPPRLATDFVHHAVTDWLDANNFGELSTGGYTVTTTLDLNAQREIETDVKETVQAFTSRGVDAGAAILVDPRTGQIRAWTGTALGRGRDQTNDLVGGMPHQPGSAIKPLLYSCALLEGKIQQDSKLNDTERVIGGKYVANWDLKSHGILTAREALAQSSNVAAAELTYRLTPQGFANCLRSVFQIRSDLHPDKYGVFFGLGLAPIPMDQLASAYTVLATGGIYHPVVPVENIRSVYGQSVYAVSPDPGQIVIDCATTAWVARAMGDVSQIIGIPRDLATKTGTTPASSFAVGFGRNALMLAWVGNLSKDGVQLYAGDVFGKDGGGQIWKDWALRHETAPADAALQSCPNP